MGPLRQAERLAGPRELTGTIEPGSGFESKQPLLTIGILTKNSASSVREVTGAIESLEYPKKRIKLVFVDDYSTDGTFDFLKKWRMENESFYHAIVPVQEHTNIPKARNLCIDTMEGDFILFWDSDVIPPKHLLLRMVEMLQTDGKLGMVGADYVYQHKSMLAKLQGDPATDKGTHAVYMGFTLIRRSVFEKVGKFNEFLDVGEDTEFGIRVVEQTSYKIMWSPSPVLHLRPAPGARGTRPTFLQWLSYNFNLRGEQYARTFPSLPLALRLRVLYYLLLPVVMVASLVLSLYLGVAYPVLALIVYLSPGLVLAARGSNVRRGTMSFLWSNVPTGIALSYGTLIQSFSLLVRGRDAKDLSHNNR